MYKQFLSIGVQLQENSKNIKESKEHYDKCCDECLANNYHIGCMTCAIKLEHDEVQIKFLTQS